MPFLPTLQQAPRNPLLTQSGAPNMLASLQLPSDEPANAAEAIAENKGSEVLLPTQKRERYTNFLSKAIAPSDEAMDAIDAGKYWTHFVGRGGGANPYDPAWAQQVASLARAEANPVSGIANERMKRNLLSSWQDLNRNGVTGNLGRDEEHYQKYLERAKALQEQLAQHGVMVTPLEELTTDANRKFVEDKYNMPISRHIDTYNKIATEDDSTVRQLAVNILRKATGDTGNISENEAVRYIHAVADDRDRDIILKNIETFMRDLEKIQLDSSTPEGKKQFQNHLQMYRELLKNKKQIPDSAFLAWRDIMEGKFLPVETQNTNALDAAKTRFQAMMTNALLTIRPDRQRLQHLLRSDMDDMWINRERVADMYGVRKAPKFDDMITWTKDGLVPTAPGPRRYRPGFTYTTLFNEA